ncbi:vascular cell adhesion 1, partial [Paramuricea clavata]
SQPNNTNITITPKEAKVGESVNITCESEGRPEPRYNITNNRIVLTTDELYTISEAKLSDNGTYECIAWNKHGNDSDSDILTVEKDGDDDKHDDDNDLSIGAIIGIVIGALVLAVIVIVVGWRYKSKEKDGYRSSCFSGNANVSPGDSAGIPVNHYELNEEPDGGVDNAYDTVNPSEASGSKSKPPEENTPSSVYAAVDKGNKDGKPLYATLDSLALQSDNSKKKRDEERAGQTEYASIDFAKVGKVDEE